MEARFEDLLARYGVPTENLQQVQVGSINVLTSELNLTYGVHC